VAAQHVAQQRLEVAAQLPGGGSERVLRRGGPADHRRFERHGVEHPLGQLGSLVGHRAQRGQTSGEPRALRTLGFQQGPQREQEVAERLPRVGALAAEREAPQGPRQLSTLGGAAADQVAEGAQLVLA